MDLNVKQKCENNKCFTQLFIALYILALTVTSHLEAQSLGSDFPNSHGIEISFIQTGTNTYPAINFAGDCENEMDTYIWRAQRHEVIPEVLPSEEDTNGGWGSATDAMQLSLRFRKQNYFQGEKVPALIILRNVGTISRNWWRNALPDMSYEFTLHHETNAIVWSRPPKMRSTERPGRAGGNNTETDPYFCDIDPWMEEFTGANLNRFFDLSQAGQYSLQVQIRVPTSDGKSTTNVVSGTVAFNIIGKNQREP